MTAEFGPLDNSDEADSGVATWASGVVLERMCDLLSVISDEHIRYSAESNRVSLHGESENAGSAFRAGMMAMFTIAMGLMLVGLGGVWLMVVIEGIQLVLGKTVLASITIGGVSIPTLFVLSWVAGGLLGRINNIEVYDHTTPKPDDRIEELADGYVDGELDREEFAAEVETVFEREGER